MPRAKTKTVCGNERKQLKGENKTEAVNIYIFTDSKLDLQRSFKSVSPRK
jgi:hypothetical protein